MVNLVGFEPILAFLIVFVVMFAVLEKTKLLGESKYFQLFLSFLVSSIFISAAGASEYVLKVVPWFAVLLVSVFLIFALLGLSGGADTMAKPLGIIAMVILILVFLVSGFVVFSSYLASPDIGILREFASTRVFGAVVLVIVGALVSWVLVKGD